MSARLTVHRTATDTIVEFHADSVLVASAADARDLWFEARAESASIMALHEANIAPAFFDLRTGLAGEVLQKLVNYRARLAVIGDIARYLDRSESLRALLRESNRGTDVRFVATIEALTKAG